MHSVASQVSVSGSRRFFLKFFCISIIHPKKFLLKCGRKTSKQFFFALNILNKAECLVCEQIIRKYSLKRHYRTFHTKLHSINGLRRNCAGYIN